MKSIALPLLLGALLAGCASSAPAPVADSRPAKRLEADRPSSGPYRTAPAVAAAAVPAAAEAPAPEVRPIADASPLASRSLDGSPPAAAPLPVASGNAPLLRVPQGGKLPYSEANLARLQGAEGTPPAAAAPAAPAAAPPAVVPAASAANGVEWGWPSAGKLLATFSDGNAAGAGKGLDFAGKTGDPVLAAAAGKVIFAGTLEKFGNLVVVLHDGGYSSVYAHNSRILVKQGDRVARGQKVAELGSSDTDRPKLHFELRLQGKPVDPLRLLPAR